MYGRSAPPLLFLFLFCFCFCFDFAPQGVAILVHAPYLRRAGTGWLVTCLILLTHIPDLIYDVNGADDWVHNGGTDGPVFATLTTRGLLTTRVRNQVENGRVSIKK